MSASHLSVWADLLNATIKAMLLYVRYKVIRLVYFAIVSGMLLSPFLPMAAYAACAQGDPSYPTCIQKPCSDQGGVYISLPISSPGQGKTDPGLAQPLNDSHCIANNAQTLDGNPIFYYIIHII